MPRGRMAGWACVLALALAAGPAASQQIEAVDETRRVERDVSVEIDATVRNVRVRGWDREELRVRGEFVPDREEMEIEGGASATEISVDLRDRRWDREMEGPTRELTISVPRQARLTVKVRAGDVEVEGVHGDVSLETVSGDVAYAGEAASVRAGSVSGSVTVNAPRSVTTRAEAVSGDVRLDVAGGVVEVEAVSGDVEIRAARPLDRVEVEAVSGRILLDGAPAGEASFELEGHSGTIEVVLPADLDARLEAHTFSGAIRNAFGAEAESTSRYTPEKELEQTVGSGSAHVAAHTFSGDVRFRMKGEGATP